MEHKRQVSYEQGKEFADKNGIKFLETSAKDTVNIDELFTSASRTFLEKQASLGAKGPKKIPGNSINLNSNNTPNQNGLTNDGGCC